MTIKDAIKLQKKYLSNMKNEDDMIEFAIALKAGTIKNAPGKEFESEENMHKYFTNYLKELYLYKDKKLLNKIDKDTTVGVKPFKIECDSCHEITEVALEPSLNFHQG